MTTSTRLALVIASAWLASGCTLEEGRGFSSIESAVLEARFVPEPERTLPEGVLTDRDFVVSLRRLAFRVGTLEMGSLEAAADEEHGHAHGEAEHSGETSFESVVTYSVNTDLDWLNEDAHELRSAFPSNELGAGKLDRCSIELLQGTLHADISGGALRDGSLELTSSFEAPAHLGADLDFEIDQDAPARIAVLVSLRAGAALFDGIDFGTLGAGSVRLDDPDHPVLATLIENLEGAEMSVHVDAERHEH